MFKDYCFKWQDTFSLRDWRIYFVHKRLNGAYAQTKWSTDSMLATITLSSYWDDMQPISDIELERIALHEIMHVLFAPLVSEAEYRYATHDNIEIAEHAIVRRLEAAFMVVPVIKDNKVELDELYKTALDKGFAKQAQAITAHED